MASASKQSANESAKDLILVHTVQLNPMIKAHNSRRMVSSGKSDIAFTSLKGTETRDEQSNMCNPKVVSRCLSTPDATSLHHCLQNHG